MTDPDPMFPVRQARIRHANEAVMRAVDAGLDDPADIARRTRLGPFQTILAIRRLVCLGQLEWGHDTTTTEG